jgi:NAD(P)-dependent dehydrogenase (short-subunit alcohol dehydrogenase family)
VHTNINSSHISKASSVNLTLTIPYITFTMAELASVLPLYAAYAFTGVENIRNDLYPAISVQKTPSLAQPGKVVLITGAGRGLGRAMALQYAYAGVAALIICARTASQLDEVEGAIKEINSSIKVYKYSLDVTNEDGVKKCAAEITEKEGRLDVLINNAGASAPWVPIAESDPKSWAQCMQINVLGPFLFVHAFLPLLVATAEKHKTVVDVINISSIGGLMIAPGASAYSMSKMALNRLSECADKGVNCVSVHPGGVDTNLSQQEEEILKPCESF